MAKKFKKVKKAKKAAPRRKSPKKIKAPKPAGKVTHFYNEISVAIVRFNKKVPVGVRLAFKGATTDFEDVIKSMQYDHKPIAVAPKGKQVGIKVKKRVRQGDEVHIVK
jgi:hypothetical protein